MGVYRKGRFWHYDFQYRGRRYYGSTGQEGKRSAETVERQKRLEAATGSREDAGAMTLDMAAGRYWDEVAASKRDRANLHRRISTAVKCVGAHKTLREIEAVDIIAAKAKRRTMLHLGKPPSDTTVNRDLIDTTMRPILNRARKTWGARNMPEIDWKEIRESEPEPEHREYTEAQIEAWKAECAPVPRFALHLLLTYGMRLSELKFHARDDFDAEGKRLTIRGKYRKNRRSHVVPLLDDDARTIAALAGRALAMGFDTIWFYGDPPREYQGDSLGRHLRAAAKKAGLDMGRMVHGARHHSGTAILRETGNLALAKSLLGHASIQSTVRYAHATEDDLRDALNGMSRNSPEVLTDAPDNAMKTKKKKTRDNGF